MPTSQKLDGWRGAVLVASTYAYFLIFAQFAFLSRLAERGLAASAVQPVMAAMALGGICTSLLAPLLTGRVKPGVAVRTGYALCAISALLTLLPFSITGALPIAFMIGAGLGMLTVSLVAHLPVWCGVRHPILWVGAGTGLGYAFCNIPAVFNASPAHQAIAAAVVCIVGFAFATDAYAPLIERNRLEHVAIPRPLAITSFAALVWLDSAAFYIIQHSATFKHETWTGSTHLWTIASVHLAGAIVASILLSKRLLPLVLAAAVTSLGAACMLLTHGAGAYAASLLYPLGVSFYSVALVAYPSLLSAAQTPVQRARLAGWLYALAGWIGSGLGIGMGQHLGNVPLVFIAVAAFIVCLPVLDWIIRNRWREAGLICVVAFVAVTLQHFSTPVAAAVPLSAVEHGRAVYISEGCMSCHSQYVRPGSQDELIWGPAQSLESVHAQRPPLIGNRRQGPDLAQVGARRSHKWLEAHLIAPNMVSDQSPMPSYAFLFADGRGKDLVAYLASLHSALATSGSLQAAWHPSSAAWSAAVPTRGEQLFAHECATCHNASGAVRQTMPAWFTKTPPDLQALARFARAHSNDELAHLVKFGRSGTEMPGHEVLHDDEIASLVLWLKSTALQPSPIDSSPTGDTR